MRFISFDEKAGKHSVSSFDMNAAKDAGDVLQIQRRYSLLELFHSGSGLMQAPAEYHYVKPSQKHSEKFLRVANVLELDGSMNIIAFWLLPYIWKKDIENIIVDTSGIAAIGLTLTCEALFYGGSKRPSIVTSHRSYGGLDHLIIRNPEKTLLLISATTSGDLREELIAKGASASNLHTIFFLGEGIDKAGNVLCDLTKRGNDDTLGVVPFKSHIKNNCPYCARKSYSIHLVGDQFSPEPAKIIEIEINKTDLSLEQHKVIERLAGIDVFKVHKTVGARVQEFYFEVSVLFKKPKSNAANRKLLLDALKEVEKRWNGMVARGAPVSLNRVVYAEYPYSQELAKLAKKQISNYPIHPSFVITDSRKLKSTAPTSKAAALVVVSCLDDSQNLMGINRDLRSAQPHGNTTYISPIFRGASKKERDRIRANLTYGENGINTFGLYHIYAIDLPEETENQSWQQEIRLLNDVLTWIDNNERQRPAEFMNRLNFLRAAPKSGMSNNLFWPDQFGNELKIRPDFTLLDTQGGKRELSQADIYVVVSAVFHSLRQGVNGKPKLEYKTYSRSVVSPDNFQRLNDGVIQASLLRSARDYELAYGSSDISISKRMRNLLLSYVDKAADAEGEALMEFLLAIASKRLTLHHDHTAEVLKAVRESTLLPIHYSEIAGFIDAHAS